LEHRNRSKDFIILEIDIHTGDTLEAAAGRKGFASRF
jgi:hypothetical protein